MSTITKALSLSLALAIIYAISFFVVATIPKAGAHAGHEHDENRVAQAAPGENRQDSDYTYTAQTGDTYSQMARKAIQTYGLTENVKLSQAQIIFAETNLTIEAGSPALNEGSSTTIKRETVRKWVEAAQKISDSAEALWATYVPYVDFNTNTVGQTS